MLYAVMSLSMVLTLIVAIGGYLWWETSRWTKAGTFLAEFFLPNGDSITRRVTATQDMEGKEGRFNIADSKTSYAILNEPEYVRRVRVVFGLVTVLKAYYVEGVANPINWHKLKIGDTVTAERLWTSQENHVARDAIRALVSEVFSPLVIMLVIGGVSLLGNYLVFFALNKQLNDIKMMVSGTSVTTEVVVPPQNLGG